METNNPFEKLATWYATSSRTARIALTVILIAVVLVLVQVSSQNQGTPMCNLLDGCQLRGEEIQRIQLALGRKGLSEFEVVGDQVQVPSAQRAAYLKAISDEGALPKHLQEEQSLSANLNPFLSRSQQKLMERNEKKRQIREMIRRLPYVEHVWFEMDVVESTYEPIRQTAVVSIQPSVDFELSADEVLTIKQIIGGALASIHYDQIVVTDLNTGRSVSHEKSKPAGETLQASVAKPVASPKSIYETSVREALRSYEGIELQIHYTCGNKTSVEMETQPNTARPNLNGSAMSAEDETKDCVVTNGTASVEEETPPSIPNHVPPRFSAGTPERVAVSVIVPQDLVEARFGTSKVKKLFGFPLEEAQPNVLEDNFMKLKAEIIEKIRPVLPVSSFDNTESYPISVTLNRKLADTSTLGWAETQELVRRNWPTGAVLLIGLMMLVFVTRSKPSKRQGNDQISIDPEILDAGEEFDSAKAEAEQELSRLIEQDPEAAAKVIKSWIRKAA